MQRQEPGSGTFETEGRRDRDLIRLYAEARSEAAFAELERRYARLIYSTCLRETGDRTLAEDASQCVLMLLSQKAGALKRCDAIGAWLYSASRYVAKNLVKQERRRRAYEAGMTITEPPQAERENALWERIEPHFHDALDRLKSADREAILLRFVQQQSFSKVGARLGISENTARMRVNRALDKVRSHLGKAGITVLAAALAILLEEHSSQAAPAVLFSSGSRLASGAADAFPAANATAMPALARKFLWRMGVHASLAPFVAALSLLMLLYGYQISLPQRLNLAEQRRLFTALAGVWNGNLEFADDGTHQHFTYPVKLVISDLAQENALQLVATYTGSASIDVTTFTRQASSGRFAIRNSGPQSSHRLEGTADLVRLRDGGIAFQGTNLARNNETRIRLLLAGNQLMIQEEYRNSGSDDYQFRNRFSLRK